MFEISGAISRPIPTLWPCLLALFPLVVALLPRRRALIALGVGGLCHLGTFAWLIRLPADHRLLLTYLGVAARIGQLDLVLALGEDPLGAVACAGACAVAALLVARQGRSAVRRIALLAVMTSAVQLMLLSDSAAMLVLGGAVTSLTGGLLGRARAGSFTLDRIADVATVGAAAIVFWGLGGSWVGGEYVPELEPRIVVAKNEPASTRAAPDEEEEEQLAPSKHGKASLSFVALPGSVLIVDGAVAERSPVAQSPLSVGPHVLRVHPGAGSDDYVVPHTLARDGEHVWVIQRGPTTVFHEVRDALATGARAAFERRRVAGGATAPALALLLIGIALVARGRILPFEHADAPARALSALGCVGMLRPYAFGDLAPTAGTLVLSLMLLAAIGMWLVALRRRDARLLLPCELPFVFAGLMAGAPWAAVVHGVIAAVVLHRPRWPTLVTSSVLLPTRVLVVAALYAMPHGAFPLALAIVGMMLSLALPWPSARLVGQSVLASTIERTSRVLSRAAPAVVGKAARSAAAIEGAAVFAMDQVVFVWYAAAAIASDVEERWLD